VSARSQPPPRLVITVAFGHIAAYNGIVVVVV
jgi:hypothetical protein